MLGELTVAEVRTVLQEGTIGRIGCLSAGRPHVVTVLIIAASLVPFGVDHSTAHGHRIEK